MERGQGPLIMWGRAAGEESCPGRREADRSARGRVARLCFNANAGVPVIRKRRYIASGDIGYNCVFAADLKTGLDLNLVD